MGDSGARIESKSFWYLEALGQAAQPTSNAGIAGSNLVDPCQQARPDPL